MVMEVDKVADEVANVDVDKVADMVVKITNEDFTHVIDYWWYFWRWC